MYINLFEISWEYDFEFGFLIPFMVGMTFFLISLNNELFDPKTVVAKYLIRIGFLSVAVYPGASTIYKFSNSMLRLENNDYEIVRGRVEKIEASGGNSNYYIIGGKTLAVDHMLTHCYGTPGREKDYFEVGDYLLIRYYEYDDFGSQKYPVKHCILKIEKLVDNNDNPTDNKARQESTFPFSWE